MTNIPYTKDTKPFWQAREQSRSALDKKRSSASLSEKARISEKLRSDASFLKKGRIVSAKH
jgi:hypothetical protein